MECPPRVCSSILAKSYSHLSFTVIITMLVWWIRYVAEVNTVVGCPSCDGQHYYGGVANVKYILIMERKTYLEILLEGVGELLAILYKFPLPLLKRMLPLRPWDVGGHLVHCVQQLLDGTCNLLDRFQECLPVGDLIWNS